MSDYFDEPNDVPDPAQPAPTRTPSNPNAGPDTAAAAAPTVPPGPVQPAAPPVSNWPPPTYPPMPPRPSYQSYPSYPAYPAPRAQFGPAQPYPPLAPGHQAPRPAAGRVPGWLLPLVAALALVVGLVGGAFGGLAYESWFGDGAGQSSANGNLDTVDTVTDAPLPADNGSVAAVARQLLPSTVQIIATYQGRDGGATGSGFVLDRQGHIITNNHVVADAADKGRIEIVDQEGNHYKATLVGRSPVYDLAVLYVPQATGLRPAALGSAKKLRVGDGVVAFGSPLGLTSTVTAGIVSAVDRPVTTGNSADDTSYINAVQTDAAINPGNSGGPLVNLAGQVVGVNSAIATTGQGTGQAGNIGVGFAIPIEQVRITADQILQNGEARYPVIGATVRTGQTGQVGARIDEVQAGTPAARAGLRSNDLIIEINGDRVVDGISLIVAIRTHLPGERVTFTFTRDGRERTTNLVLDSKVG